MRRYSLVYRKLPEIPDLPVIRLRLSAGHSALKHGLHAAVQVKTIDGGE